MIDEEYNGQLFLYTPRCDGDDCEARLSASYGSEIIALMSAVQQGWRSRKRRTPSGRRLELLCPPCVTKGDAPQGPVE